MVAPAPVRPVSRKSAMSSRFKTAGFTLIELLVVLAIMVGAVSLVVPRLVSSSAVELRAAARTLAAGLRRAREQAIATNASAALGIDVERRQIYLQGGADAATGLRQLPNALGYRVVTARSELVGETGGRIRFYPDGTSTGGRITVSSDRVAVLVDVDWLTGRIQILDGTEADVIAPSERLPLTINDDPRVTAVPAS